MPSAVMNVKMAVARKVPNSPHIFDAFSSFGCGLSLYTRFM